MNPELEKKLAEKYPSLFRDRERPPTESLMCFGCECEDGWFNIIDALCRVLSSHVENGHWKHEEPLRFVQIKEKFGTLRMYTAGSDDYVYGAVDMAETISGRTCEACGKPARVRNSGMWLKTLCEDCADARGYSSYDGEHP